MSGSTHITPAPPAAGELDRDVAELAHAVASPLCAILGLVDFLVADAETGSKAEKRLLLVRDSAEEIRELLASFRARRQAGADSEAV